MLVFFYVKIFMFCKFLVLIEFFYDLYILCSDSNIVLSWYILEDVSWFWNIVIMVFKKLYSNFNFKKLF